MKLGIGFSYLNAAKEIPRSLMPWYPHVDHIIAVDGRYRLPLPPYLRAKYKDTFSTDGSEEILNQRFGHKLTHERFFGDQLEKRQRILDIAGELKCDYLIMWDSDEYIMPQYSDWYTFFKQLECVTNYFRDQRVFNMWAWLPDDKVWAKQYNEVASNTWRMYARIHKDPGTMRYAQSHYTWAKKEITDHQINMWKWENKRADPIKDNPYYMQPVTTLDAVRFTTDRQGRDAAAMEFGDGWAFQNLHYENLKYNIIPYVKYRGGKMIGMDLPVERYYFKPGKWGDADIGQIVLLNEDGTETMTQQQIHTDAEIKRIWWQTLGRKLRIIKKGDNETIGPRKPFFS